MVRKAEQMIRKTISVYVSLDILAETLLIRDIDGFYVNVPSRLI